MERGAKVERVERGLIFCSSFLKSKYAAKRWNIIEKEGLHPNTGILTPLLSVIFEEIDKAIEKESDQQEDPRAFLSASPWPQTCVYGDKCN
jgi:hypothetical protein